MTKAELSFTVSRTDASVARLDVTLRPGDDFWCLLSTDRHHDNKHCDKVLEREHLDLARERGAAIVDLGDLFCAMQGKWDPRGSHQQTTPDLEVDDYSDVLVGQAYEFYRPYAKNFAILAQGNHEDAINKRCQTNLTRRLARELKAEGSPALDLPYQGWVSFSFTWNGTHKASKRLRYTHGYGGGGPVTKDLIQANRQLVYTEDCDLLVSGHTHDTWHALQARHTMDQNGKIRHRTVHLLKCGGYKDEFTPSTGWAVGKGRGPKVLGAVWLRFYVRGDRLRVEPTFTEED